jgi:hypothetical protein
MVAGRRKIFCLSKEEDFVYWTARMPSFYLEILLKSKKALSSLDDSHYG